jgi:hypothetical protein
MKEWERAMSILNWALKGQQEPPPETAQLRAPSIDRIKEALEGRRPFDAEEQKAMLHSPAARGRLRFLAEAKRAERLFRWRELAVDDSLELQAAAGGPLEPVSITNTDFTLTALPLDDQGNEWLLHLKISPRLVSALQDGPLVVRDEQGETWMRGVPDDDGELSVPWTGGGSPIERFASQRLIIEPV